MVVDVRGFNGGERFAVDHCIRGLDDAHRSRITVLLVRGQMSGLIKSEEGEAWIAATWVFDNIMSLTRKHLDQTLSNLHSLLDSFLDEEQNPLRYLDLGKLTLDERAGLRQALHAAYGDAASAGSESFSSPEFYPGFMDRFRELIETVVKQRVR